MVFLMKKSLEFVPQGSPVCFGSPVSRGVPVRLSPAARSLTVAATVAVAAAAAALPCVSHAQVQLKEIVVTATRSESRADAAISDVTTITREDIERGTGRTVSELLARVSGVQMAGNGGLGKSSSVFKIGRAHV